MKLRRSGWMTGLLALTLAVGAVGSAALAAPQARKATSPLAIDGVAITDFLPVPKSTEKRLARLDPETGLAVWEAEPGIYVVTEGVYMSAFLETRDGIVVFDAPPTFAEKLPEAIHKAAPGKRITQLIYSHGHTDHIGGAGVFANVEGLEVIAHRSVAASLSHRHGRPIPLPTRTFEEATTLTVGGERIELKPVGNWHSPDADVLIYLPRQKFVLAIDSFAPGFVPFKGFAITADLGEFIHIHDEILALDFEHIVTGHPGILGTRKDVEVSKEYLADVQAAVLAALQTKPPLARIGEALAARGSADNPFLGYRYMVDTVSREAADAVIGRWKNRLGGVDVWAKDHCETMLLYLYTH